jgi:calcineurin-like phosphoesterase family protein
MLRKIKVNEPPHKVWFLSDLHYGHDRDFIYGPRGFKSVAEHDETLAHRWNALVSNDDVVFHLGDLMCNADVAKFWALMRRLNFKRLYILLGNHPSGQKQAYLEVLQGQFPNAFPPFEIPANHMEDAGHYEVYPLFANVDGNPGKTVTFLPEYVEVSCVKEHLILCHYPIASHHHIGHGAIHICGHTHSNLPLTHKETGRGRRLDVGVESFGAPINLTEVKRLLQSRDLDIVDHHGKETT